MIVIRLYEALNNYVNLNENLKIFSVLSDKNKAKSRSEDKGKTKDIIGNIEDTYNYNKKVKHRKKTGDVQFLDLMSSKDRINSDILRTLMQKEIIRMKYGDEKKGKRNLDRLIKLAHRRYDKKGSLLAKIFNRSDFDLGDFGDDIDKSDIMNLPFHHLKNLVTQSMPITRNINKLIKNTKLGPSLVTNDVK